MQNQTKTWTPTEAKVALCRLKGADFSEGLNAQWA
jgi:hypothetical protein